jgi:hypothetical protein
MSRVSCQSSRECCRNFGNVPATSGTFPKFPQGRSAIFRWTPSIRRGFAKSALVGIYASLLFLPACAKEHRLVLWALSTLTRPHSWGVHGSMSGVAHLCRAARGMCARAQRRPVPWDSCPPIATACVVAIPIRGSQRADRDCWLDICFEKFLIDDRSLVEPLCVYDHSSLYQYGTFGLECLLFWGFLSAQLLLGPPRPRILRCFQICAQNWQQPSGTEVVAVQSWGPGPIK